MVERGPYLSYANCGLPYHVSGVIAKESSLLVGSEQMFRGVFAVDARTNCEAISISPKKKTVDLRDVATGDVTTESYDKPAGPDRRGRDRRTQIHLPGHPGQVHHRAVRGAAAWTGASEKTLRKIGENDYEKIYLFPNSHAGYYPGARMLGLKVIYRKSNGRLLGVQAIGDDAPAVDKRISALAVAIQMDATIEDLEESELCYAPQFGSAKDAVNFAGMVAADVRRGDMPLAHWAETDGAFLLDVRQPVELIVESVPGAVNIPLGQLRARLAELPRDREILAFCRSAQRSYYATRILLQNGFKVRNISGGMLARAMLSAK